MGKEWGDRKMSYENEMKWEKINNGKTMIGDFRKIQKPYKGVTLISEDQTCGYGRILKHGCEYGIHKKGCRDIQRGLKKNFGSFGGVFPRIDMIMHFDTLQEGLDNSVPDYAHESDMYDDSIKAHKEGTIKAGEYSQFVYVYPCCKDADCGGDQE